MYIWNSVVRSVTSNEIMESTRMKRAHALSVVAATLSLTAASCSSTAKVAAPTTTVAAATTAAATKKTTAPATTATATTSATTAVATSAPPATVAATTPPTTSAKAATTTAGTAASGLDGLFLAVPAPADPAGFAKVVAVTADAAGNPIVGFTSVHAADDARSDLFVSASDPKTHAYAKPVAVATIATNSSLPLSMAYDPASSSIVLAYEDGTNIGLSTSTDGGVTWKNDKAATSTETLTFPKVVVLQGNAVVLYTETNDLKVISTPLGSNTTPADSTKVVAQGGGTIDAALGGSLATDGKTLGVAFFQESPSGGKDIDFWTVGSPEAVKVGDTAGAQNDSPSLALAYTNGSPVVAASLGVKGIDTAGIFFSASTDQGATFGTLTLLPGDASAGPGFTTAMVTGRGKSAAIAYASNTGSGDATCGQPKLVLSTDEKTWVTCSPTAADDNVDTNYPALAASNDGRLFEAFTNSSTAKLAAGIYVASIPPAA